MRTIFLLSLIGLFLMGCGVKPSRVDPPGGAENDNYPATYPNPSTDPR